MQELVYLLVQEFSDRNVILLLKVLRKNRVKELDNCDLLVVEEFSHSSVQVLKHRHYNVVGLLAQEFGDGDIIFRGGWGCI